MAEFELPTSFGAQKFVKNNINVTNKKQKSLNISVNYEVEAAFNKWYSFFSNSRAIKNKICILPHPSLLFQDDKWKLDQFIDLKDVLNNTKSKLNNLNLKEWHQHTTNMNVAGEVVKKLRHSVAPEFLTQAWCKMYECLYAFPLVPKWFQDGYFNSVHLCEAPGAFIAALHHYLQTWCPDTQWNWLATTLNPYHESNPLSHMIQDDRFILHTLDHWSFGEDGTGDLMDRRNLCHLQDQAQNRLPGGVLLVTADGSIDCQINPAEQEALVAPLHYCETLTALSILEPGGSFMVKMFTLLECDSICLLYLLSCVFGTVDVFKPVKSKEGNSEVYVLCTEYIGRKALAPWMPTLMEKYGPAITKAMFSIKDIPEEFISQMYECAKYFTNLQMKVIERNLALFMAPNSPCLVKCRLIKRRVSEKYLEHYELKPIGKVIVGNLILSDSPTFNLAQKYEEGTFNDRVRKAYLNKTQHIEQLWGSLQALGCQWPYNQTTMITWFMFNNLPLPQIEIMCAQPVMEVCSSKFCNGRILEAYIQVPSATLIISRESVVETSAIIDASQFPWSSCCCHCHLVLLETLACALDGLEAGKNVCIRGLPLLTQFTVATVFLLAHSFDQLGLSVEGDVFLCGYQLAPNSISWVQSVLEKMRSLPSSKAVLSILPISILCDPCYQTGDGTSFYMTVSSINNSRLMRALEAVVMKAKLGGMQMSAI